MPTLDRLDPERHDCASFECGELSLDRYLQLHAFTNHCNGIATTHVLAEGNAVLGYFSLSAAQLQLTDLQPADRLALPRYPVPAVRMGRLAIASEHQRKGLGELLLGFAVQRSLDMRKTLGARVMVVDALASSTEFYLAYGFRRTSANALTLYLPLGAEPARPRTRD
jgi:GNAT superfamily N-acetyltransferase